MFEKIKRGIIRTGRHKGMRPFALLALWLLYGGKVAAHFCVLLTGKDQRRKIAFILCFCMVFNTLMPLKASQPQEKGNIIVSGFSELSAEVLEQTVPVGTLLEGLNLPDTLEAEVYAQVENTFKMPGEVENILSDSGAAEVSGQSTDTAETPPTSSETEPGQEEGSQSASEPGQEEGSQSASEPGQEEGLQSASEPGQEEGLQSASEPGQEENITVSSETVTLPQRYTQAVQEQPETVVLSAASPAMETTPSNTQNNTVTISGITWNSEPVYNPDAEGTYRFTAVLPEGYALGEGLALPQITVRVREADALPQILARDYNEETSSDMVLYLEQAWDAYLWESCQDGQWTPIEGETGPELHLTKDEFLTLGYRCRVTAWGAEILSQAYWAIPADLTSQVSRFSMLRAAAGGQSDYLKWDVPASSGRTSFNILGMPGSYKTTFWNNGYYTRALVNGNYVHFNNRVTDCAIGGDLFASLDFTPIADGRYLQITYIVENRGAQTQDFQIGSSADIMIDTNDRAPIKGAGSGTYRLIMSDGKGHQLDLVAPGAATLWYGHYSQSHKSATPFCGVMYDGNSDVYRNDSGIAYSWKGSVAPGETWRKYALIGTGPQTTPGLLLNPAVTPTTVNTEVTISGKVACATNCTVYATLGDDPTKHTLYTGSSGPFSTVLDMSGVADGPCELRLWAVDAGGATSDLYSFSLDVLHPSPQISLSESAITLEEDSAIGDPTAYFQGFIDSSMGTITIDYGDFTTAGPGVYTVRYTASMDGKPSATGELTVTVTARALELEVKDPVRAEGANSFTLSALVKYPGPTAFSETGFVWGISQNPTLQVNIGAATGVSVGKGDEIVVTAADLVEGLTYYARPYVILEGGATFYGGQTTFSIGGKSYGTFSVANNGNSTFTVTRSGGSDGEQKVYYRTVNGSAVGGTHFTHAAGSLTFREGEISKTVTVSGENTNAPYGGAQTTAYSNAARTYQLEIYKVEGGGLLSNQPRATRTLEGNQSVDRKFYDSITSAVERGKWTISDSGSGGPHLTEGKLGPNRSFPFGIMDLYPAETKDYLNGTATGFYYRFSFAATEDADGWEHVWVGTQPAAANRADTKNDNDTPISLDGPAGPALYTASFELDYDDNAGVTLNLPAEGTGVRLTFGKPYKSNSVSLVSHPSGDGEKYFYLERPDDQVYVHFGACGSGNDTWTISQFNRFVGLSDKREPQFLGIAPMAGGTYKPGDTFYLSLVFDEIVDSANSAGLPQSTRLQTNYGEMTYAGGLDTNVLVFQGKVPDNATGNIQLNSITGIEYIKDLCSEAGGSATASSGSVSITVDSTTPTVRISENSAETGMLAAQITATNFSTLQYVWSGSSTPPSSGWSIYQTGEELQVRQSADTKYLHARAIWENTGRTTYAVKEFTFSVDDIVMPELTLSVDNTAWANSRTISVTRSHSNATVTYSGPESGTASGDSVTVTQNGTYTFILTYGSETVVRQVAVSRLDGTAPLAEVSGPSASAAYGGAISVAVAASDSGGSGMKSLSGVWNSGGTTRDASGLGLAGGNVACPDEEGQWTLTLTATDNAGNTATVVSGTYTIVKKQPSVAVNRISSSNQGDVYNYTVTIPSGVTLDTITLPDGTATKALTGKFTLTQPGTWYLLASDTFGHVVASAAMEVSAGVDGTPPEVRLSASTGELTKSLTITASVFDNVEPTSATWKLGTASPANLALEEDASAQQGSAAKAGSFTATQNGVYTVTAKDAKGNTGSATIEIKNIDNTAPDVSMVLPENKWHNAAVSIPITYSDSGSGIKTAQYAITTSNSGPAPTKLSDLPSSGSSFSINDSGTLYIYYCVTDHVGNVREGYSDPILLDMTTPSLKVSGNPTAWTNQPVTLNLEVSAPSFSGQSLAVKKNSEDFKTITEKKYTVEENGNYQFTVTTGAGKTATKTVTVTKIDRTAPANATLTLNPASPDTGSWYKTLTIGVARPQADSGAPITTYYKLWEQGSAEPANGIALSHDATAIPTPGDGKWNVLVYTQDEAGNRSEDSATLSFQLDTKAPVIGTLEYQYKAATLWDWIIGKKSLIIVVPVTEEGSGADEIVCSATTQGGTAPAQNVSIANGKATITFSEEFQGQIEIDCTDKAGNAASLVKVGVSGVIVEERAPQVTFAVPEGTNDDDWHKEAFDVTVKVTDKDNGSSISGGLAKVEWKLGDKGTVTTITTPFTSKLTDSYSFQIPISADGQQIVYVQATDNSGNQSNWESVTVKLDTTAPEITEPILTPDQWTNQDVSVSFAASDLACGIKEVTVGNDTLTEKDGKYTFTVSENKKYSITATDNVGNVQTLEVSITNIDKTPPAGPSVGFSPNGPDGNDDWYRTAPTIIATGSKEEGGAPITIYYKLWEQGSAEPANGIALSHDATAIPTPGDGKWNVLVYTQDEAGNRSEDSATLSFQLDTSTPVLSVTGGDTGASSLTLTINSDFSYSGGSLTVKKDNGAVQTITGQNTYAIGAKGSYVFTAASGAGKEASVTKNVYGVTFDSEGGSDVSGQLVVSGGKAVKPENPVREGYDFVKWVTAEGGSTEFDFAGTVITADTSIYASWRENIKPELSLSELPGSWQNDNVDITLSFSDNVGVTKLYVKTDDGDYSEISGFGASSYAYTASIEGEHSYVFKAEDAAGNYAETAPVTVKLDKTVPSIGTITYDENHQSFWEWIFGKTSLEITVPVTDTLSGADKITYVLTPAGGSPQAVKNVNVNSDGNASFVVSKDFKGEIAITAYDKAGNGKTADIIKAAVEDHLPTVTVTDGADKFGGSWYNIAKTFYVTARDGENGSNTEGGLNTVTYTVDGGNEQTLFTRKTNQLTYTTGDLTFDALEGEHTYLFTVTDNAGNQLKTSVTVKQDTKDPHISDVAAMETDFDNMKFTFTADDTGTWHYMVKPSGQPVPDVEDILAQTGTNIEAAGSPTVFAVDGLDANTDYVLYIAVRDKAENKVMASFAFKTAKADLTGSVSLDNSAPRYGDILTATTDITSINPGPLTYEWYRGETKIDGASGDTYTITKEDIGKTIKISVTADNYAGSRVSSPTEAVGKKQITAVAEAQNKTYDGTTAAVVSFTITRGDVLPGDIVLITADSGFADANVGNDKTVILSNVKTSGTDGSYYELLKTPELPVADISKADVQISELPGVSLNYGQKLEKAVFSGGSVAPEGSWKWNNPSSIPTAGGKYAAVYFPADAHNYNNSQETEFLVTVNPGKPAIELTVTPEEQTDGQDVTVKARAVNQYAAEGVETPPDVTLTWKIGEGSEQTITGDSFTIPAGTPADTVITVTARTESESGRYLAHVVTQTVRVLDKFVLTDSQVDFTMPGWTYGSTENTPSAKVTVTDDINGSFTYSYSIDGGKNWIEKLPKSATNYVKAGSYKVKADYIGDRYIGSKIIELTVRKKELTAEYAGEVVLLNKVPVLLLEVTGFIPGEGEEDTAGLQKADGYIPPQVTFPGNTADAGTYVLTPAGGEADNYSFRYVGGTLSVEAPRYTISVTPEVLGFETVTPGYRGPSPKTVTVTNTGNSSVTLKQPAGRNYIVGPLSKTTLAADETATFTVQPRTGLPDGGHGEVIIVETDHATMAKTEVRFRVKAVQNEDENAGENGGEDEAASDSSRKQETDSQITSEKTPKPAPDQTETTGQGSEADETTEGQTGTIPEGEDVINVPAQIVDGKIVLKEDGGKIEAGSNPVGGKEYGSVVFEVGEGAVIVTVSDTEGKRIAAVRDTQSTANAVLTPREIELVNNGATIEIRVDVKDIAASIPDTERELVAEGLTACQKEVPEMQMGMYLDISLFLRVGNGEWSAVTVTDQPFEVTLEIPERLRGLADEFYIIRVHEGAYELLRDMDEDPATITVSTHLFSTYVITYRAKAEDKDREASAQNQNGVKCGLCHICPTFLGICLFVWLVIAVAIAVLVAWVYLKKKRQKTIGDNRK